MCGRFTLTYGTADQLALELGAAFDAVQRKRYRPRYNIAPSDEHWVLRGEREERELLSCRWGLTYTRGGPRPAKRAARPINARAETIDRSPAFREAFGSRRCVVPADGYFEWTGPKKARRPIWFHRGDGGLLLFAGLYEVGPSELETPQVTFTIITTKANRVVERVHDRMPVVLDEGSVDEWLFAPAAERAKLHALLLPAVDDALVGTPVNPRVNAVRYDDPECLAVAPSMLL